GLYAHTTGADTNRDVLDRRYRTMAHHFSANGYYTGLVGKMHFNDACNHGFEYYMSINDWLMYLGPKVRHYADEIASHQLMPRFFETVDDDGAGFPDMRGLWGGRPSPWVGNVTAMDPERYASELEEEDHLDAFVARESVRFLENGASRPFLLIASFMKPHTPFHPPRRHAGMYPLGEVAIKDVGDISGYPASARRISEAYSAVPEIGRKSAKAGYYGNLAFVDECIGALYGSLERLGLLEDTIVVYTSDHGEMDGDHGMYQKFCMFEPSVKVPMIVSMPGTLAEGVVSGRLINQIGLYQTLADLTGTGPADFTPLAPMERPPKGPDAVSFAEKVLSPDAPDGEGDEAFVEYRVKDRESSEYMVRVGKYKYAHYATGEGMLFDLEADPGELMNLAGDAGYADVRAELLGRIRRRVGALADGPR
ncbi:MAG: sulfatase-like hydrolase/transferase, partial [Oscillospiraceae bacterium]|nr:sulfatase-like hydrolase/transferase [Oscillospiraceae bacterium]